MTTPSEQPDSQLLPCPFCGSECSIERGIRHYAGCGRCRIDFNCPSSDHDTEIVKRWNTRTPDLATLSRQRDALKAALEQVQWLRASDGSPRRSCPKCCRFEEFGHQEGCVIGVSLAQLSTQGGENVPPVSCAEQQWNTLYKPHNPHNLTEWGQDQGYRLLNEDEIADGPMLSEIEGLSRNGWCACYAGDTATITYRTKLSRSELAEKRGSTQPKNTP